MKPKLAVIVTHPIQHFAPVYKLIAERAHIDIVVIYLTDAGAKPYFDEQFHKKLSWDIDVLDGYRYQILRPGLDRVPKGFISTDFSGIGTILDSESPDSVLIYGYTRSINWRVWLWTKLRRRRLLYWSDSVLHRKRTSWRLLIKRMILPIFFRGVDICLVAGDCNARYFRHYGIDDKRMHGCPLPVDIGRLRNAGQIDLLKLREEKRAELQIATEHFVVAMCGKLYDTKRPVDLLKAVLLLREQGLPVVALFIGSGALLQDLQREAALSAHPTSILFAGFVNQSLLPAFYAASDVLAIPSSEDAHPLVATEAATFGLPLVVSDEVGCVGPNDVAREGANALIFRCGDIAGLAAHIRELYMSSSLRQMMISESLEIAETQDITVAAASIETAVLRD